MSENEASKYRAACDPGWNDPPLFSYDTQQAQVHGVKRTHLNKRVMFPVASGTGGAENMSIPPLLNLPYPGKPPSLDVAMSSTSCQEEIPLEEIPLSYVMENFNIAIQASYTKDKEKQSAEVRRRLEMMSIMWNENQFNPIIKEKIFKLSEAIKEGDFDGADSFQRSLMVDYSPLCSTWMSGIRHLLNSKRLNGSQ